MMEINSAYCENDGPRELEIFSDDQVEEVMESLEYFRSKIEQLQLYCEQVNQSKLRSDEALLEQKRKHKDDILKYQEKVNLFRGMNVQLMSGNTDKEGNYSASSFCCATNCESNESQMQEMESKLTSLELTLAEKEKHVSVMEWQIMDMEATMATLQAERDQLVLELEYHDSRDSVIESCENLEGLSNEDEYRKNDLGRVEKENRRKTKTLAFERPHSHSDLWADLRGPENLSLKQLVSLSAGWLPKDSPMRMRRPPQRTYSAYMKRDSQFVDFSTRKSAHSLEDFDNLSEVDSGLGLGRLTRTTNFCDILDADEYSDIHVVDNRLSFTGDSVQGERVSNDGEPDTESSRESLAKKWETFDGDARNKETGEKTPENDMVILEDGPTEEPFGTFDGHSLASSTSDFSSVFHSSQDGLLTSSNNEICGELVVPEGPYKKISKKHISKSDSCISMKRSPSSDKDDMWNFTPDSILNVSTGEVLSPTITDMPSIPTITKSRSFTTSLEIILKDPKANNENEEHERTASDEDTEDTEDVAGDTGNVSDKPEDTETVFSHTTSVIVGEQPVKLRNTLGENLRVKHGRKSRSVIESTHQTESYASELGAVVHQKSLSDPVKDGEKSGRRKLNEYQKWRKYGRRGKPPGDLRISNC